MDEQFNLQTETEKHEKYTRKRIDLTLDDELITAFRLAATVKTIKGKKSSTSGLIERAMIEFMNNHYQFFNLVKEYVDKYGVDGRYL